MKFIHITTGDPDGIGLEVALKALNKIRPVKGVQFVLWRSALAPKDQLSLLKTPLKRVTIKGAELLNTAHPTSFPSLLKASHLPSVGFNPISAKPARPDNNLPAKEGVLWDLALPAKPTQWVAKAGALCWQNPKTSALVTGPLSKTQMQKEGFKERGHTGLLKRLSKTRHVFMCFLGDSFNVALLTGHTPLKKVLWSKESLNKCIALCLNQMARKPVSFLQGTTFENSPTYPLGVLGFNPHAGEEGLLGTEEAKIKQVLDKWQDKVKGPLVPDTAFFKENWSRFFMYICMYHDQGLIPFKMVHGRKSFQLSLGLPFIRVSVSHGTSKDIYGQNKADPESMRRALLYALSPADWRSNQSKIKGGPEQL